MWYDRGWSLNEFISLNYYFFYNSLVFRVLRKCLHFFEFWLVLLFYNFDINKMNQTYISWKSHTTEINVLKYKSLKHTISEINISATNIIFYLILYNVLYNWSHHRITYLQSIYPLPTIPSQCPIKTKSPLFIVPSPYSVEYSSCSHLLACESNVERDLIVAMK